MIDRDTIKRDAQANILDWPVKARHLGRALTVGLVDYQDVEALLGDGAGLLGDMSLSIMAIKDDFGDKLPKQRDRFEIQLSNGIWKRFDVANVIGYYDPVSPTIQINLQSPHKG